MFFRENKKIIIQAIFGFLFIGLAFFFIRYQRAEIIRVKDVLSNADLGWLLTGMFFSVVYVAFQGLAYTASFRTINERVPFMTGTKVFLKRFFISVFIPAGGVASLGFFTRDFERKHVPLTKTYFGSSIYAATTNISLLMVAIPTLIWALAKKNIFSNQIYSLVGLFLFAGVFIYILYSLFTRGIVYRLIIRIWPAMDKYLSEIRSVKIRIWPYTLTVISCVLVELVGVIHLMIAMWALGLPVSIEAAFMGYITAMLFQVLSPFMRGLGAIELSVAFVLTRYGFSTIDAISITLLYRFFAFWFPLLISGISFGFVRSKMLLRVFPAIISFVTGIVNIIAVLTPAVPERLALLQRFLPATWFEVSGYFLMIAGLSLLVISPFLLKGLSAAWFIAMFTATLSFAGNILAGLNYQEAMLAALLMFSLLFTRRHYLIRGNPLFGQISIATALMAVIAVMIYGITGFFFLQEKQFSGSLIDSVRHTMANFFLFRSEELGPASGFTRDFIASLKVAGFLSMAFLFITLIRPLGARFRKHDEKRIKAAGIIREKGHSSFDHYKILKDKFLFFSGNGDSFLAYKVAGNYALVLEDPVAAGPDEMRSCIDEFTGFCFDNGLKCFYFPVPEKSLEIYEQCRKKHFLVAQEAIIELKDFRAVTLPDKLRHLHESCRDSGYSCRAWNPPADHGVMDKLQAVSESWLKSGGRREAIFTQGTFDRDCLKKDIILTIENNAGNIIAFLNIIPGSSPSEAKFDLLRKSEEAPEEVLSLLVLEFILFLKKNHYQKANLGFAPMPGLSDSGQFNHMSLKFAYEKICAFPYYEGWREFRDQFNPEWHNRYVVYDHHYDLYDLPAVLKKVSADSPPVRVTPFLVR